jgi:hypothetical protein
VLFTQNKQKTTLLLRMKLAQKQLCLVSAIKFRHKKHCNFHKKTYKLNSTTETKYATKLLLNNNKLTFKLCALSDNNSNTLVSHLEIARNMQTTYFMQIKYS